MSINMELHCTVQQDARAAAGAGQTRLLLVVAYFGDVLGAPRVLGAVLQRQELGDRQRHAAEVLRAHRPACIEY